ncbi:MAG: hypothetical protein KC931_12240, partial [Candidatus Omnitrophica bacterium]|nr:hypothetical protein [Candidatus Omnitrophota bacterium]
MNRIWLYVLLLPGFCSLLSVTGWGGDYHLASFQAEVTAPIGHALMGGGIAPASEVVDPLYCKGVVLLGSDKPFVVASIDWCEIRNAAYDRWRETLANAAGTDRERVFFSCIHQHDTPVADLEAQRLLDQAGLEQSLCDVAFHEDCVQRVSEALKAALKNPIVVTHYGIGQANVD